jgi:Putative transposase
MPSAPSLGRKPCSPYLARYTHRVAISNSRLIKANDKSVTFKVKNYRAEGRARYTTMTLEVAEFIRRFLVHVLPKGFHRIRHYGFLASATKAANLATARERLNASVPHATTEDPAAADADALIQHCPCCGGRMHIIETFARGETPHHQPSPGSVVIRIDTS